VPDLEARSLAVLPGSRSYRVTVRFKSPFRCFWTRNGTRWQQRPLNSGCYGKTFDSTTVPQNAAEASCSMARRPRIRRWRMYKRQQVENQASRVRKV